MDAIRLLSLIRCRVLPANPARRADSAQCLPRYLLPSPLAPEDCFAKKKTQPNPKLGGSDTGPHAAGCRGGAVESLPLPLQGVGGLPLPLQGAGGLPLPLQVLAAEVGRVQHADVARGDAAALARVMGQQKEILPEREGRARFSCTPGFFFFAPHAAFPKAAGVAATATHQSELVTVWSMTVPGGGDVNCSAVRV